MCNCSKSTHSWALSIRVIVDPVSTSVASIEQSGEPVNSTKRQT